MRRAFFTIMGAAALLLPVTSFAAEALTYRYGHHIFTIPAKTVALWQQPEEVWTLNGRPFTPPANLRVDGDALPPLPEGVERGISTAWNDESIRTALAARIASFLNREPGKVTIKASGSGGYAFEGAGFPGRSVDIASLALLTEKALEANVSDIFIPVTETPPEVIVEDADLKAQGVQELVAFGESEFAGSPVNRRHNIAVGLARFNGYLIKKDATFSFVEVLGPVDGTTGYRKELVIKGDRTEPDYGGGLCQVSTTAYRGAWEYGFPIDQRRNHSYAVRYYGPYGTDATTYLPKPDMQFTNDSPGDLLIQTLAENDQAYFFYYGTKDDRKTDVVGPYIWGMTKAPPPRTEYTTALSPGVTKVLGHAVPGLHAAWFRVVKKDGKEITEPYDSIYEARPDFFQVGVATMPTASGAVTVLP